MSVIKSGTNFIKQRSYIYDDSSYRVIGSPQTRVEGPVIKAHQTALSYAEKYRLGILTYPEYLMWQTQIMLGLADTEVGEKETEIETASKNDSSGRFWENDSEIRQNVSDSDYERFLSENSIDVSTTASVDIASLIKDTSKAEPDTPSEETNLDDVLRNVNKDIKGSDILSEAEIAALFAAAGN